MKCNEKDNNTTNGILLNENYFLYIPYALGAWAPTIAAFFASKKNNKVANFKEWLKNIFDFKHNIFSSFLLLKVNDKKKIFN